MCMHNSAGAKAVWRYLFSDIGLVTYAVQQDVLDLLEVLGGDDGWADVRAMHKLEYPPCSRSCMGHPLAANW